MPSLFCLRLEGFGEEPCKLIFDSRDEAISHARKWFISGYTEDDPEWHDILDDAKLLQEQLLITGNFYCGRGYESVVLEALL